MRARKNVALIAHDNRKQDLLKWVKENREVLRRHMLFATGDTSSLIGRETGLFVYRFKSGSMGGDHQIGAKIADGGLDFLIFFWDPLLPHPHDPDVKALLRIAVLYDIPVACNRASANFMISSPLMNENYQRLVVENEAEPAANDGTESGLMEAAA
jgi:methylglyoxal synthase